MGNNPAIAKPSSWVTRFAPLIAPGGAVLDLASGGGRHARLLLDRGHAVTALDRDIAQAHLAHGAELISADLEDGSPWPLAGRVFAGIVVTNYLWRPLFAPLIAALEPGGVLIYETFAQGNEAFGRPRNPDHLLQAGELLRACAELTVIAYEHGIDRASVIQRICATNAPNPCRLNP